MLEVVNYSNRRGVIVPLLPKIYALLAQNAEKDVMADLEPPPNILLWKQAMRKTLLDLNRRWLFALDAASVAGLLFYHFEGEKNVYIDELQIAWPYRHNGNIFTMLTDKFQFDREVKACERVYVGKRIKVEENSEILAAVGFKPVYENGWQLLGSSLSEAIDALKLRYIRKV